MTSGDTNRKLIELLQRAQSELAQAPISIIGTQVIVSGGSGGGDAYGIRNTVIGGSGAGDVIGSKTTISGVEATATISVERERLQSEINDAIEDLRDNRPRKSTLRRIAERLGSVGLAATGALLKGQIEEAIAGLAG
ncbi:hypothetical protein PUR23_01210 [Methylorubrum populi]|uniref:hypothetical protein n=1 Tax=Methylorubrum populi TaxID=223967 RepID=UPI0031FA1C6D